MKLAVFTFAVLFCLAGHAHGQALKAACGTSDACDDGLTCVDNSGTKTCMAKIGTSCTADSTDECVTGAANCPSGDSPMCMCPPEHRASADNTSCVPRLNVEVECPTAGTKDCIVGATCKDVSGTLTCVCNDNSVANGAKDKCLMFIMQTCSATDDCVADGKCIDEVCTCENKTASYDMMHCKISATQPCTGVGDECGDSATCKGDPKMCECDANYYNEDGRCGKKVGVSCTTNSMECVMNAECKASECSCKTGYEQTSDNDLCKENGAQTVIGSVLLLLAAMMTSRLL